MARFYDEMQSIASELFVEFDQQTISYVRMTPQAGATPDAPLPSTAVVSLIVGAVARGVQYKYVMRGMAVASDLQIAFAGNALVDPPSIHDFVEVEGVRLKIVEIVARPAAGTVVAWTLICRK